MISEAILVLNAGSSSLKFAVYPRHGENTCAILRGKISGIGTGPKFTARDDIGSAVSPDELMPVSADMGHDALIPALLAWLKSRKGEISIIAAGHRVVHGGQHQTGPALVSDALLSELDALSPLAPLHQPHNLAAIRIVASALPGLPQIACFDTSFHRTQPRLAQLFALPCAMTDTGIIRYGFHGLSYEYIASVLPEHLGKRAEGGVVVAHLGNGASMCALKARTSVATSMGFTALDGLMMGNRCGTIDPGVLIYLMNERSMTAGQVEDVLYNQSGLFGVSGISNDMAVLEASAAPEAKEAIDLFCYRAACELAALTATIEGLDAIVFTAGIGENSARVRKQITGRLAWLGIALDADANAKSATRISAKGSAVDVLVLPTDEEVVIARAVQDILRLENTPENLSHLRQQPGATT